nr:hypothetical protein [Tanacetum cinerariifolium]
MALASNLFDVYFIGCGKRGGVGVDEVVGVVLIGSALLLVDGVEDVDDCDEDGELGDELVFRDGDDRSVFIDSMFMDDVLLDAFELFGIFDSNCVELMVLRMLMLTSKTLNFVGALVFLVDFLGCGKRGGVGGDEVVGVVLIGSALLLVDGVEDVDDCDEDGE